MTNKHIAQLVSADGKAIAAATSAPGCFIHDGVALEKYPDLSWGGPFSEPGSGNSVDFYVTGEEYFQAVASAIAGATKSIYIAGWQVNFDVELAGGKTLFQCLEKAIDANPTLRIFVMPWLSPKVGVDTGDFETMLAVFQLNAGHPPPARAFAVPAIAQSDMSGGLGIGFSHHQKLVVIDDRRAFVGGIDLAYGRRDDGRFSLAANGRAGNELYNSCIPAIHELSQVEQTQYLTRAELLCACFDGLAGGVGTFATSAVAAPIAHVSDTVKPASDALRNARKVVGDWWATSDLLPDFVRRWQDIPIDAAQGASRWAYHKFDQALKGKLEGLRATGSAHAANAAAVLLAWLNNASTDQLPAELRAGSITLIEAFTSATLSQLSHTAARRTERYPNLGKLRKILPASGKTISPAQPRMPWHDVQCAISGPAVSDLSKNFVRRWNGIACRYEKSNTAVQKEVAALFAVFGVRPLPRPKLPRLAPPLPKTAQPKAGKSWVQVLRSAPRTLQRDEAHAEQAAGAASGQAQNNCLKAMLTAIQGAQQFIYIEGQFFQSAYGEDQVDKSSGTGASPMATLTDPTALAGYERYAKRLGIDQLPPDEVPGAIRWSQVDDVQRDAKGAGAAFIRDLKVVLNNLAATKASQAMGPAQDKLLNPIGEALARRIEQAIYDKQPFHVYMVLPVHPEGALNTLNIMTQLHLTMQSLVFGSHSLVNRIRRTVLVQKLCEEEKLSIKAAQTVIGHYPVSTVVREGKDDWKEYLTLLNLRNWEMLEKRPVTEQVYVHSKLLIADDRVAILGSANINDRSQLGDRDSELAVIVRDDEALKVKLDGVHEGSVSTNVHRLRMRLWKKLFGLMGSTYPATSLAPMVDKPAARDTWKAIQRVAHTNALAYQNAFPFLAKVEGEPSPIWPTWNRKKRSLKSHMPFNERFWRPDEVMDKPLSWEANARAQENAPTNIQGFIVALPVSWTAGEDNSSKMNLTLLANNRDSENDSRYLASAGNDEYDNHIEWSQNASAKPVV